MESQHTKSPNQKGRLSLLLFIALALITGGILDQRQRDHASQEQPPVLEQTVATAEPSVLPESTALATLEELPIKGRAPKTGYTRAQFGDGWQKTAGCDMRNRILQRDLQDVTLQPEGCVVRSGILHDPYSGKQIDFVRGAGTSQQVQIDHVVALSDAWQKGAQLLSPQLRVQLANDPLNLLAVDGALNNQKGAGDAATWLPPNKSFRCAYAARQVAVKYRYHLWVTLAERDMVAKILKACPETLLPAT